MFRSHEKSPSKMKFQKPNILRKRSKVSFKGNVAEAPESMLNGKSRVAPASPLLDWSLDNATKHNSRKSTDCILKSVPRKNDSFVLEDADMITKTVDDTQSSTISSSVKNFFSLMNNNESNDEFISIPSSHRGFNIEGLETFDVEVMTLKDYQDSESKWRYVSIIDGEAVILPESYIQVQEVMQAPAGVGLVSPKNEVVLSESPQLKAQSAEQAGNPCVLKMLPANSAVTFMCDSPGCSKGFPSQQKLKKHKNTHKKASSPKNAKQVIECPANKMCSESWSGDDKRTCGQQFNSRTELLKHLKEEHTLDDAAYSCADCQRPFYWASGVRNHARACLASGRARCLVCQWPNCGRVFQQPCRLKEHVRAHTGDKPYPCRHPDCPWSFRTASKLLRHARRHTGERRHQCAYCGRAFLRAEHMREHAARHHGQRRAGRAARHPPLLQQSEPNAVNTSLLSVLEQTPEETDETSASVKVEPMILSTLSVQESTTRKPDSDWSDGDDLVLSSEEMAGGASEERAARTHCTWPLPRRSPHTVDTPYTSHTMDTPHTVDTPHVPPTTGVDSESDAPNVADVEAEAQPDEFVYEVELPEGSESKIYTIRSDLFLHGNVIHSEDSEIGVAVIEHTVEEASNGATLQATPLDTELGLLDAQSSIDLMQNELLYTDEAVDGSSFQLLGDGDLQTYYTHVGVSGVPLNST